MDFYTPQNTNFYLTSRTKWWWLPKENGSRSLVVSVTQEEATLWVVAYTILVTLIFMAACELATAIVLTSFKLGNSGTRHAILVSYYNAGRATKIMPLMLGYLKVALFRCKRKGKWAIDWTAVWASFGLFLLAFSLISGDLITRFFLGGKRLIEGNVAQANPAAVFYPSFEVGGSLDNTINPEIVDALKTLVPAAVSEAKARRLSAQQRIKDEQRISYHQELLLDGTILQDGTTQNGTGARFEYEYHLTGYEMGLRDAPGLVFRVRGKCATYHGPDSVIRADYIFSAYPAKLEEQENYPYFGDSENWYDPLQLGRENYTAPFARFLTKFDDVTLAENEAYGGWTFMIIPHTAWRLSNDPLSNDPWYETEVNPGYNASAEDPDFLEYLPYRVKSARPPLRCTQNDTWSYGGQTVNHINKLDQLPGLKLSRLIGDTVFGREFGSPVFSKLLGNLPLGTLGATAHFIPLNRRLDVQRVNMLRDFRELVEMGFVYSREVVRNTVLLYSVLQDQNESVLYNAAVDPSTPDAEADADFFLESKEVAAMSVYVLVITPSVCVFLWLLVLFWSKKYNPESTLNNKSAAARHGLRLYGLRAVQLFRYLDEELSQKRKWSGRNTQTPFIRDLDAPEDRTTNLPASIVPAAAAPPSGDGGEDGSVKPDETRITGSPTDINRTSMYAKPKVLRSHVSSEAPGFLEKVIKRIKGFFSKTEEREEEQYEVAMTRAWNSELKGVAWKDIRENV